MAHGFVNDLIDEWRRVIIFGAHGIEFMIICANIDRALFFVNQHGVIYPRCILDWVDEVGTKKLVDLRFNSWGFSWV